MFVLASPEGREGRSHRGRGPGTRWSSDLHQPPPTDGRVGGPGLPVPSLTSDPLWFQVARWFLLFLIECYVAT